MRFWILPIIALCLCSCSKSTDDPGEPSPQKGQSTTTGATVAAPNGSAANVQPAFSKPTAEQVGSTVRVRVAFGGLPPRESIGALLHREEIDNENATQGRDRFVVSLLKGFTEQQLHDPSARLVITRNRTDAHGQPVAEIHPARLLNFDASTGLAVLTYVEEFDYGLDVGFHLERSAISASSIPILRAASGSDEGARGRFAPPFSIDAGVLSAFSGNQGQLQFSATDAALENGTIHLAVQAPDKLLGFLEETGGGKATLTPIGNLKLQIRTSELKPVSIAFGKIVGSGINIGITTQGTSGDLAPSQIVLRIIESPDDAQQDLAKAAPGTAYRSIETTRTLPLHQMRAPDGQWTGTLAAPSEGEERIYLLQLSWSLFPGARLPTAFGQPFLVKLKKNGDLVHATTVGLVNLNDAPANGAETTQTHPLEAEVYDIQSIAGGREVLMRFKQAPHWKRFSLSSNQWLPLPPGHLASMSITGNLSSLYVLDRGASEVRKYSLPDLKLQTSVKLPNDKPYTWVASGCNSDRSPVFVASSTEVMALASDTLQRLDSIPPSVFQFPTHQRAFSNDDRIHMAGDGLAFTLYPEGNDSFTRSYACTDDLVGVGARFFDFESYAVGQCGVSAAYLLNDEWMHTVATPGAQRVTTKEPPHPQRRAARWLLPNSPVILRLFAADESALPPQKPKIECFSYFDDTPFAVIDTPELYGVDQQGAYLLERTRWLAFDPYSARLGVVAVGRKQWVVHQVVAQPNHKQPVLLNWPDTLVARGGKFVFSPVLLGGSTFSADVMGTKEPITPQVAGGSVSFPIVQHELSSLMLTNLKVPGAEGRELVYPVPIHVRGSQLPLAISGDTSIEDLDRFAAGFKSLAAAKDNSRVLNSTRHALPRRTRHVLGPVGDYLALITAENHVDFFSLKTRTLAGSIGSPADATYFAGADAIFEYNPAMRTLTRIGVPHGRREKSTPLPAGIRLHGLAVGRDANSPLTLILEQVKGQATAQGGDWTLTATHFDRSVVVLDSRTLQAGSLPQPRVLPRAGKEVQNPFILGSMAKQPVFIPSSHSGHFMTLPNAFILLSQRLSVAAWFTQPGTGLLNLSTQADGPIGSISGMRVVNRMGDTFVGGVSDHFGNRGGVLGVTSCGRYRLCQVKSEPPTQEGVEVRTVENDTLLFRVGRLSLLREEFARSANHIQRTVSVLSDAGPLAILSAGGKLLQLVDLDIPKLAKEMSPSVFHVTSQAPPCMIEGGVLEYQIQVNNPDAVASYRLRTDMPGASISATGMVRYQAPRQDLVEPSLVTIPAEIIGRLGETVPHEIPIFLIPLNAVK